jgi:uracil phosphoribosyltransferase
MKLIKNTENNRRKEMAKLVVMDHPLIQHKLTLIRDKQTGSKDFRDLVDEVATLMAYEVTRDLPLTEVEIQTPVARTKTKVITGKKLGVVPVLRAGLGMVDGILKLVPAARVGHVGLYRDPETLQPVEYYCKLPADVEERELIVVDPMLATGGSASAAITFLKNRGCSNIKLMCLIAAPEGIEKVQGEHPDVDIFVAAVDKYLNDHGYIVPGLGDAGDRLFGTK